MKSSILIRNITKHSTFHECTSSDQIVIKISKTMKIIIILSLTLIFSTSLAYAHLGLEDGWVEHTTLNLEIEGKQYEMIFAAYHDSIAGFEFNETTNTSTTTMPFDWSGESIQQLEFVHAEYYIPKEIEIYEENKIRMFVNDIEYFGVVDRSPPDEIVVHFLIQQDKLLEYSKELDMSTDVMTFSILPGSKIVKESGQSKETSDGGWLINIQWEPAGKFPLGEEIPIRVEFRDPFTKYKIPQITYDYTIEQREKIIFYEIDRFSQDGKDSIFTKIDSEGPTKFKIKKINGMKSEIEFDFLVSKVYSKNDVDHQVIMTKGAWQQGCEKIRACFSPHTLVVNSGDEVLFENQDEFGHNVMMKHDSKYLHSQYDIINPNNSFVYKFSDIGRHDYWCSLHPWMEGSVVVKDSEQLSIPEWIKNNAAWWADGEIDDNTFASGIEFMIKQGIIQVPSIESNAREGDTIIPDWLRNGAAWWADGEIDDNTFASGIQFLISEGIISV